MRTRTALIFENPLKMTKVIERAGLKWPPDVPLHCYSEKNAEAECRADLRGAGSFAIMGKFIIRSSKNSQKRWVFQEYFGLQNSIHVRFNLVKFPIVRFLVNPLAYPKKNTPSWYSRSATKTRYVGSHHFSKALDRPVDFLPKSILFPTHENLMPRMDVAQMYNWLGGRHPSKWEIA